MHPSQINSPIVFCYFFLVVIVIMIVINYAKCTIIFFDVSDTDILLDYVG